MYVLFNKSFQNTNMKMNSNVLSFDSRPSASEAVLGVLLWWCWIRFRALRIAGRLCITASVACFLEAHLVSERLFSVRMVLSSCMFSCPSSSILNLRRLEVKKQYKVSSVA